MRRIVDPAAGFVPACMHVFGRNPEVVDGGRAVLLRDTGDEAVKLSLEAGERELWVWRVRLVDGAPPPLFAYAPTHERRIAEIEIRGSIENALHEAKEVLGA
jgi:hypothetical protein